MFKSSPVFFRLVLLQLLVLIAGCGGRQSGPPSTVVANKQGHVYGGGQPVSGSMIQLYAVSTVADGGASTALLSTALVTDANGGFDLTGAYTCPASSSLVYIVASGGHPGPSAGSSNAALALMAALGSCGSLSSSTVIQINELTTVAAVYALAPYLSSSSAIGAAPGEATQLANAFTLASEFVDTTKGSAPGTGVPAGTVVPIAQINTIGDIITGCIDSSGGTAGDKTACGTLFSLTTPTGGTAATETTTALLHLANNPTLNTAALFSLIPAVALFQPAQQVVPPDLAVRLTVPSEFTFSPAALSFPAARIRSPTPPQMVTFMNNTAAPIGIDAAALGFSFYGADPDDFASASPSFLYSNTCPNPVLPGAMCSLEFAFDPSAIGARSAYVTVANTSANPVISILFTGEGLEANAGPASFEPPALAFTASAAPANAVLTNSGTTPLTIDGITIGNDPTSGQPAFTETNTCGVSLAAMASCAISVSALATAQLYSTGVLTVGDDAAAGAQTLQLSYSNGFSGPVMFDFGSRSVGTQGFGGLEFEPPGYPEPSTLTLTGSNSSDFSFLPNASSQTTPCNSSRQDPDCVAFVYFTPSATGIRTATLNVNGTPIGGLIGTGLPVGLHFSASVFSFNTGVITTSLDFGLLTIGQTSPVVAVNLVNTGTVPLTLNAPAIGGAGSPDFKVVSNCSTLAPNAACVLSVTATLTQPGNRLATLTVADSTGSAQQAVPLKAIGSYPGPVATPAALNFPYTPLGTISAPQSFTVTAYNNDPVMVILADAQAVPFFLTQTSSCTSTPCQIAVAFAPTAANTAPADGNNSYDQIVVTDLLSGEITRVSLSGISQMPAP